MWSTWYDDTDREHTRDLPAECAVDGATTGYGDLQQGIFFAGYKSSLAHDPYRLMFIIGQHSDKPDPMLTVTSMLAYLITTKQLLATKKAKIVAILIFIWCSVNAAH